MASTASDVVLLAGYTIEKHGTGGYRGALRLRPGGPPVWTCRCKRPHQAVPSAQAHARAELERRRRAGDEVFELLRCDPCGSWYQAGLATATCPRCAVPLARLKVLVLERSP